MGKNTAIAPKRQFPARGNAKKHDAEAVAKIIGEVADKHHVCAGEMKSETRYRRIAYARMEACYRLRVELKMSYPLIGRIFERDHTTARDAYLKVKSYISRYGEWQIGRCEPQAETETQQRGMAREERLAEIINAEWERSGHPARAIVVEQDHDFVVRSIPLESTGAQG